VLTAEVKQLLADGRQLPDITASPIIWLLPANMRLVTGDLCGLRLFTQKNTKKKFLSFPVCFKKEKRVKSPVYNTNILSSYSSKKVLAAFLSMNPRITYATFFIWKNMYLY
jgi:hypothetical protein